MKRVAKGSRSSKWRTRELCAQFLDFCKTSTNWRTNWRGKRRRSVNWSKGLRSRANLTTSKGWNTTSLDRGTVNYCHWKRALPPKLWIARSTTTIMRFIKLHFYLVVSESCMSYSEYPCIFYHLACYTLFILLGIIKFLYQLLSCCHIWSFDFVVTIDFLQCVSFNFFRHLIV